jgi:hypothetical protein
MNFLRLPKLLISPDAKMTPEQLIAAKEIVEKLVALGTREVPLVNAPVVTNAPLFILDKTTKADHPIQYRILANMNKVGQNQCIGSDPTVFPKAEKILHQMYSGGNSTV